MPRSPLGLSNHALDKKLGVPGEWSPGARLPGKVLGLMEVECAHVLREVLQPTHKVDVSGKEGIFLVDEGACVVFPWCTNITSKPAAYLLYGHGILPHVLLEGR